MLLLVLQGQVTQYDGLTQIKKEKCSLSNLMNVGFQYQIYHHIRKYLVHRQGHRWGRKYYPIRYIHIISWINENDLVYDCFIGSGTTAKMAILNNRNYIGSEISKELSLIHI